MISPLIRQLLVAASLQLAAFAMGGAIIYPGVLLQQLRANDSLIHLDLDTSSWIGSIDGLSGIPSILMPMVMQSQGRQRSFIAACAVSLAGWLVTRYATSATALLASECLHGLGTHCLLAVSMLSMSEMIVPRFRSIAIVCFFLVQALGMVSVSALSHLHWKTISLVMSGFLTLAILIACSWPESPAWLAYRRKFSKCEQAFAKLRGTDEESMRELEEMIIARNENSSIGNRKRKTMKNHFKQIMRRDFYLPSVLLFLLLNLMYGSGTLVILIYPTNIIQKSTRNEEMAALGGTIMSSILFLGIMTTAVLLRFFSNKAVLLFSTVATTVCLSCTCAVTYLQSVAVLSRDSMLCLYCLVAYMIANSLGVNTVTFSMAAELMPVKHRGLGGALFVVFTCVLHTSSLKISPYLFEYIDLWGTFLIYAINAAVSGMLMWNYVPETKGRTLQEIEDYYKDSRFVKRIPTNLMLNDVT